MRRVAVVLILVATGASAADRLDHRGSVGLLLDSGLDFRAHALPNVSKQDLGLRFPIDLGGTANIGYDQNEVLLLARLELGDSKPIAALTGGYRGYFGTEEWKTFFDLDARAELTPYFTIGPRIGFGLQYELSSLVGVTAGLGAHVGAGNGLRFGGELLIGLQFRSYLLE